MTTTLTNSTGRVTASGVAWGVGVGLALCLLTGLSPFSQVDRNALALLAITVSVLLGVLTVTTKDIRTNPIANGRRGVIAGLALALVIALGDPMFALTAALWIVPASLIGAATVTAIGWRWFGVPIVACWILLCGLPFLYETSEAAGWIALHCNPWLGMSFDVVGGNPLTRDVIYMGEKSRLIDEPAQALMTSASLWLVAFVSTGALAIRSRVICDRKA
ncbi:hypothetical protein OAU50_00585 [Planctomycetota bacterium]|nr:hypothetical protein [Planctomycetota bacterium]